MFCATRNGEVTGAAEHIAPLPGIYAPANAVGIDYRTSAVFGFTAALSVTTGDVPGLATKSK
jgi:hypothetical protein